MAGDSVLADAGRSGVNSVMDSTVWRLQNVSCSGTTFICSMHILEFKCPNPFSIRLEFAMVGDPVFDCDGTLIAFNNSMATLTKKKQSRAHTNIQTHV